jgi:ribonuclease HII
MSQLIAGIDEVGRGSLAGPALVGAVVIADPEALLSGLEGVLGRKAADSKQLTKLQRERASVWLRERVGFACGIATAEEINNVGIVEAIRRAAGRALDQIEGTFQIVQADANLHHPYEEDYPTEWFIKGDERILPILCASIIAKVERDRIMTTLATSYPGYAWEKNAGYGAAVHRKAIQEFGLTPQHRELFCRNTLAMVG